jgi:hypothetical protein
MSKFSSKSYTLPFPFRYLIHIELIFIYSEVGIQIHSFVCGYSVVYQHRILDYSFPLDGCGILVKSQLTTRILSNL